MKDFELLKKKLEREVKARKQAENILETKAFELYEVNEQLKKINNTNDELLDAVSKALTVLFQYEEVEVAVKSSINILGPNAKSNLVSVLIFDDHEKKLESAKSYDWSRINSDSLIKRINSKASNKDKFLKFCDDHFKIHPSYSQSSDSLSTEKLAYLGLSSSVIFPIYEEIELSGIILFELIDSKVVNIEPFKSLLRAFSAGVQSAFDKFYSKKANEEQKQFYESVLNSIPSDLVVFDKNHRYKFVNPTAVNNDKTRNWLIGKDDYDYVQFRNKPKEIADKRREVFNKVVRSKQTLSFDEKLLNNDGISEWKHRIMYPVTDKTGNNVEMVIGYALDITDIKKAQEDIIVTSTRLTTLISSLHSGVLLEDSNRKILVTNEEFCSIFGIEASPEQLIGFDCSNSAEQSKHLIENPVEFVRRIDELVAKKEIATDEEIVFKDGRVFERDFIPIYNNEDYLGHLWEYKDVTIKKESEKLLITAREEAEESKRLKQRFLANMSHEIRTPMNGVIGIVHLLERTHLDTDQKKYLDILKGSSEHLLHIINDILDVSKIEEGKLTLVKSPVQIDSIIDGVLQNLKSRIDDKNLLLIKSGLEIFDSHLLTDPVRIRQILLNLLSNAIKFTHKGKIEVNCFTLDKNEDYHKFKIQISDTGIGIPSHRLDNIYEAFNQVDINTSAEYGGTGLGLNIVKDLVKKMNGTIEVESEEEKGSTFIITLELEKAEKEIYTFNSASSDISNSKALLGTKILVADDHEVNFTIANEIISIWGAEVIYARDGEEAVNMVIENNFDLVLMDMQMPNIDGIEATKMIRMLDESKSTIPIIAMTAAALPEERERCLQSGMNDYISKPYSPVKLYDILINHIIDGSKKPKKTYPKKKKTIKGVDFDLSYLQDLSGNNPNFIHELIDTFKKDMPDLVGEMNFENQNGNISKVAEIAHKAKSMAGYLGCEKLRDQLIEIENLSSENDNSKVLEKKISRAMKLLSKVMEQLKNTELK